MDEQVCSYLGTLDQENNQRSGILYPSFENVCFAQSKPLSGSLLLADQATYCLSGGAYQCPRYQLLQAASATPAFSPHHFTKQNDAQSGVSSFSGLGLSESESLLQSDLRFDPTTSMPLESDIFTEDSSGWPTGEATATREYAGASAASRIERSRLLWIASAATFLGVLLCGVLFAAYAGWQLVSNNLLAATEGAITPLAVAQPTPTIAAVVIVITSQPPAQDGAPLVAPSVAPPVGQPAQGGNASQPPREFPQAVTPTPIVVDPNANVGVGSSDNVSPAVGQILPPTPTPVPEIDVNVVVPTPRPRQPTPDFLIPPTLEEPPSPTPSPTATWPPPVVIFGPDDKILPKGKCTMVRWTVENVRAVYYENLEVIGTGEKEECIDDKAEIYLLNVILPNGSSKLYTTTVEFLGPTATPTATETFTPEPQPTATWTPLPPTATPTPDWVLGTTLRTADGENSISCAADATCEIGLLVTNGGNVVDTLEINLIEQGAWPPQLCRQDGVCSPDRLLLSNVGEGNTAYITLRLAIPADATPASTTYTVRSVSQLSEGRITSDALILTVDLE